MVIISQIVMLILVVSMYINTIQSNKRSGHHGIDSILSKNESSPADVMIDTDIEKSYLVISSKCSTFLIHVKKAYNSGCDIYGDILYVMMRDSEVFASKKLVNDHRLIPSVAYKYAPILDRFILNKYIHFVDMRDLVDGILYSDSHQYNKDDEVEVLKTSSSQVAVIASDLETAFNYLTKIEKWRTSGSEEGSKFVKYKKREVPVWIHNPS